MTTMAPLAPRYLLAEFASPEAMLGALPAIRDAAWGTIETHTPYPVHQVSHLLHRPRSPVPMFVLVGGLFGVCSAWLMQWWCNAIDYPLNVGGRPLSSLPSWIPIMFELTVLFGSFAAFFGMWALSRLPQPYHPVFRSPRFTHSATIDGFWVRVRPRVDLDEREIIDHLERLGARHVDVVERP